MRATVKRGSTLRNRSHDETWGCGGKETCSGRGRETLGLPDQGRNSDGGFDPPLRATDVFDRFPNIQRRSDSPPSRNDTVVAIPTVIAAYESWEKTPRSTAQKMRVTFYTGLRMATKAPNGFGARAVTLGSRRGWRGPSG